MASSSFDKTKKYDKCYIEPDSLEQTSVPLLGKGMFGEVNLYKRNGSHFVIKTLNKDDPNDVFKEFAVHFRFRHHYIVELEGWTKVNGVIGIVMEYMPGGNLEKLIENEAMDYSFEHVILWARNISEALNYLFVLKRSEYIHGDIKPANMVLNAEGLLLKLCDFGNSSLKAKATEVIGSFTYMAPEMYKQTQEKTSKCDYIKCEIYSWAASFWHCVMRSPPFSKIKGKTMNEKKNNFNMQKLGTKYLKIPTETGIGCEIKEEFRDLIEKCTNKKPGNRYSINEVVKIIDEIQGNYSKPEPLKWAKVHTEEDLNGNVENDNGEEDREHTGEREESNSDRMPEIEIGFGGSEEEVRKTNAKKFPKTKRLFILGGMGNRSRLIDNIDEIQQTEWRQLDAVPDTRLFFGCASYDEKVYICGGKKLYDTEKTDKPFDSDELDPSKILLESDFDDSNYWRWRVLPDMRTERASFGFVAAKINNISFLMAAGGMKSTGFSKTVELFNLSCDPNDKMSRKWKYAASIEKKCSGLELVLCQDKILAIGGKEYANKHRTAQSFDFYTNQWTALPSTNKGYSRFGACFHNGSVYVCDGTSLEVLHNGEKNWMSQQPIRGSRITEGIQLVSWNDKLLAIGGGAEAYSDITNQVWMFDPRNGSWHETAPMITSRMHHRAVIVDW